MNSELAIAAADKLTDAGLTAEQATELLREVRKEAIVEFVGEMSAVYRKHSGEGLQEDMILACLKFDVDPAAFYDTPDSALELKALVAYHRVRGTYGEPE